MQRIFTVPITVVIIPKKEPVVIDVNVQVDILPAATPEQEFDINYPFIVSPRPIDINLSQPIITSAYTFLENAIENYVDEDRSLKTLLNYGEDRQSVVLRYRYGSVDTNGINRIQLKLLQPVPDEIQENSVAFLSREVAKTVIDKVRIRFAPPIDFTPYLRPKNVKVDTGLTTGKSVHNLTLQRLKLQSGSVGLFDPYKNKTFEDQIFRQWYSYDFNSSELNIDFTDYNNFIFYGSAAMRLRAFREKLIKLENLEIKRLQFISSSTYVVNNNLPAAVFVQEKTAQYAKEKEDIIRAFDRYEQYLFFTPSGSISPYSVSAYYADEGIEYHSIGYWPKNISGSLYPVTSTVTEEWYETQLGIAQRFDEFNENNLVNTIPTHVRDHEDNAAYITFVTMVGHFFDTIKPYIDQFPEIYSRNLNPSKELSKDLINEIAESIGFRLPSINSVYDLTDDILGSSETEPRRNLTAEIYKRLLHNLPFYAKAKGTKTALDAFIRAFGITPQLISVKETGTPVSSSYYVFDEYSTGLDFDETKTSYVRIPILASSRNPTTLQFNMTAAKNKTMTVLTGDDTWALNVRVHPSSSNLGRFELLSGSSNLPILTSSYHEIYNDELINVAIQIYPTQTSSVYITQVEGEDIVFGEVINNTSTFYSLWNSTQYVYVGGAGPRVTSRYEGLIDDLRLWNTILSEETLLNAAFDPGSNAGDTYDAAINNLLIYLTFNNVSTGSLVVSSSLTNQSPYKDVNVSPSLKDMFTFNIGESDFTRYNRKIKQDMIIAGTSGYVSSKVKVAPEPVFVNNLNEKRLFRTKSIVSPESKRLQVGRNKVIIGMSPTEIINQNIIRNFGYENINAVLGSPTTLYNLFENSLSSLKRHYQKYHYVEVNTNRFIRVMSEVTSVLDQVVDYFIPSKATLLKGILIEPNILEQVKVPLVSNISFYGKNTRKTLDAAGSLTSSAPDYGATFNVSKNIKTLPTVPANNHTYQIQNKFILSGSAEAKYSTYRTMLQTYISTPTSSISNIKSEIELNNTLLGQITQYSTDIKPIIHEISTSYENKNTVLKIKKSDSEIINVNYSTVISGSAINVNDLHKKMDVVITSITSSLNPNVTPLINSSYIFYTLKHYTKGTDNKTVSNIDMGLNKLNKINFNSSNKGSDGAEPYNRLYSRKLFTYEIDTPRHGGNASLNTNVLYDIPPTADFRDVGVYTYFSNENGIYTFPETIKTPVYSNPLNQKWNIDSQQFESITTWSYGSSYNINDVVYQDVTTADLVNLKDISKKDVFAGNKRYYVFKNRPVYQTPTDNTFYYSGSVSTFTPPSLDRNNWEVLRFTPIQKRVPRRVVFDTFSTTNPVLNNFRTTTVSIDRIIDSPDRYIDTFEVNPIAANSYIVGEMTLQNIVNLFAIQSNISGIRLRLYRTETARDADILRDSETRPLDSHGVLLDSTITNVNTVQLINPVVTLIDGNIIPSGRVYYTINNIDPVTKIGINIQLFYFALQIEPRIPSGYLRKHYRFFRDNSTATKRRHYEGCKNTQETTFDGLPPVQVFLSEGTELVISRTQTNQEIITGGGGTLNVT